MNWIIGCAGEGIFPFQLSYRVTGVESVGRVERRGRSPSRSLDHQKIYPSPSSAQVGSLVGSVPLPRSRSLLLFLHLFFPVQYSRMISFGNEGKSGVSASTSPSPALRPSLPLSLAGQFRDKNPFDLKGKRTAGIRSRAEKEDGKSTVEWEK